MKSILEKIDSLPDIQVEKTKKNLLGKEKPIKECSCGKSFDLDIEYCPNCSKNMKGFKEKEQANIDLFRAKTISLEKLLIKKPFAFKRTFLIFALSNIQIDYPISV